MSYLEFIKIFIMSFPSVDEVLCAAAIMKKCLKCLKDEDICIIYDDHIALIYYTFLLPKK